MNTHKMRRNSHPSAKIARIFFPAKSAGAQRSEAERQRSESGAKPQRSPSGGGAVKNFSAQAGSDSARRR